jgi:hypothetical protein
VGGVGGLLRGGVVLSPVRGDDVVTGTDVALIGQGDEPGRGQLADDALDPRCGQVMDGAGQGTGDPQDLTIRAGKTRKKFSPIESRRARLRLMCDTVASLEGLQRPLG